jgi:hypothetical protein
MIPATYVLMAKIKGVSYGEIYSGAVLFYVPVAYLVAAVFGVPMFLLLRAIGLKHVLAYVLGGVIIGVAAAFVIRGLFPNRNYTSPDYYVFWVVSASLSALAFRLVLAGLKYDESPRVSAGGGIIYPWRDD